MKQINIIVPCYNEELNIADFYNEIIKILSPLSYSFDILFVNDGSRDPTLSKIKEIINLNTQNNLSNINIKFIDFSRNFGKEVATSAGLIESSLMGADACLMIDADLQHPIEHIPDFLSKWEGGAEVVIGVRTKNEKVGLIKSLGSKLYYKIINSISTTDIIPSATDYRLIDAKVTSAFSQMTERDRMTRGLIDWLGFRRDYIYFEANERNAGVASYSHLKLLNLALSSFISHSLLPLKFSGYLGMVTTLFSGILGLFIITEKYLLNDPLGLNISNVTQLAVFIVFLIGIVMCTIGLLALYIALISTESSNRPLYVIRERN
jgi:polyisoprenyl-phosphate glycosyltransferase